MSNKQSNVLNVQEMSKIFYLFFTICNFNGITPVEFRKVAPPNAVGSLEFGALVCDTSRQLADGVSEHEKSGSNKVKQ
jgi:hypothetical protein